MMIQVALNVLLQAAAIGAAGQDYATAWQQSVDSGKPLVVLVGADWCPGCQQMKNGVIPEATKRGMLNKVNFAHVNTERDSALASKLMQGGSIPQLVMYYKTDAGWKRDQITGATSAGAIQAFIAKAGGTEVAELESHQGAGGE